MNIRTKRVLVDNNITKLAVLFSLVGAMMIVVPMLTEQVHARTTGVAKTILLSPHINVPFTNVKEGPIVGEWVIRPRLLLNGHLIEWQTRGLFGGNERGSITADLGPRASVTFSWNNPISGDNTCSITTTNPRAVAVFPCQIPRSGNNVIAHYEAARKTPINSPPDSETCLTGTENNDNLVGTSENDCIDAGNGNDQLVGLAGDDKLNGENGKDSLVSGDGNDELTGGPGPDTFNCGSGNDKITDFKPSEGDKKTSDCEQF